MKFITFKYLIVTHLTHLVATCVGGQHFTIFSLNFFRADDGMCEIPPSTITCSASSIHHMYVCLGSTLFHAGKIFYTPLEAL